MALKIRGWGHRKRNQGLGIGDKEGKWVKTISGPNSTFMTASAPGAMVATLAKGKNKL